MDNIWLDCRHAVRLYGQTPRASLVAVFALAAGIALVGAFLSLYVGFSFRPASGFEQGSRIATIRLVDALGSQGVSYGALERMAEEMSSIETTAMVYRSRKLVGGDSASAPIALVSRGFFSGLRPRLALGRGFELSEHAPEAEPVVVLSNEYWRRHFDADPGVLGTTLEIAPDPALLRAQIPPGRPLPDFAKRFRIVGVMAESMSKHFPDVTVWVPVEAALSLITGPSFAAGMRTSDAEILQGLSDRSYVVPKPGVSVRAVSNELNARYADLELPANYAIEAIGDVVASFAVYRDTRRQLELFLAASVLLALVAAVNVGLFLLARAPGRRRELGIRLAVGAPMRRLVRQLATESVLLIVVASVIGLALSAWLAAILTGLPLMREADWRDATLLDWRVLGAAAGVVLVLALAVSLAPIAGIKRLGIGAASRRATAPATLAQRLAGTVQIAAAGALGGAAIAFAWHLGVLMAGDRGYDETYLGWSVSVRVSAADEATVVELARRREAIEAIPGVTAVAFGVPVPTFGDAGRRRSIRHPDDPEKTLAIVDGVAEQRYVDVLGLRVLHGSIPDLLAGGKSGVLVNQTFARAVWGREDVVGEHLPAGSLARNAMEIVAVLEDASFDHPAATVPPIVWKLLGDSQSGATSAETIIRASLSAADLQRNLDRLAESGILEPEISPVELLQSRYDALTAPDRARGLMTMATAAFVVLLAALGFYGTQRYLVAAGRREYALRAAVGADPRALGRLVVLRSLLWGVPGLAVGACLAFAVAAWLRDTFLSREVSPALVAAWLVVGLVLLLLAASRGPAREARRTQPALLLREE